MSPKKKPARKTTTRALGREAASPPKPSGKKSRIRVLIADDHAIFRRGLKTVLSYEDEASGTMVEDAAKARLQLDVHARKCALHSA